jgi:hypothetical protein
MQLKKLITVAIVGAAVMLTVVGCGRGTFVTVDGQRVSKDEFHKRLENLPLNGRPAGLLVLDQMINEQLVMELSKKMSVEPTDAQVNKRLDMAKKDGNLAKILAQRNITVDDFKSELKTQQALFNVMTKGVDVNPSDVRRYYDKAKDTVYTTPERVKISAVICKTKKDIDTAQKQLKAGTDFSSVVINLSDDDMSKHNRTPGELGWVWHGQKGVPPNLIDAAFKLKKMDYSEPFQVVVGGKPSDWVVVRCMDHEPKKVRAFDEVKDQIRDAIAFAKGQQEGKIAAELQQMRVAAKIKINSDKYKLLQKAPEAPKKGKK